MLKTIFVVVLLCASSILWAKDAQSALLSEVDGEALLFQNGHYTPVKPGQRVSHGDRLMIMEKSKVHVVFDNGCEVTWDGAMLADIDVENCPSAAGLWIPCVGSVAAKPGNDKIILTQLEGSVLVLRDGQYLKGEEGMELQENDLLKIDGMAEVNYKEACTSVHENVKQLKIDKNLCPIAMLTELEGTASVKDEQGVAPAKEGLELKNLSEIDVPQNSKVKITYFNGCEEVWDGEKKVEVNAEHCPLALAAPAKNCSPAIFAGMTTATAITIGGGIIIISTLPGGDNNPPPPVSP